MKKNLLITFGCSWTYGTGCSYEVGMPNDEYIQKAWDEEDCATYSFRGLLSSEFDCDNLNFGNGGSSNNRQFRLAKELFISTKFKQLQSDYENIIVLWGITSTGRREEYCLEKNKYVDVKYDVCNDNISKIYSKFFVTNCYSHDNCVEALWTDISFFDKFFKCNNINHIWFDTFNHHDYPMKLSAERIDNFLFLNDDPRDLMSKLAINHGLANIDNQYHASSWKIDSDRVSFLTERGILNPLSYHPTKQGHIEIANMFKPMIKSML